MKNETYNGWTNYATWRVNLEIFDGMEDDSFRNTSSEGLKEYVEDIIFQDVPDGFAKDYASCLLAEVNWQEIRDAYNGEDS